MWTRKRVVPVACDVRIGERRIRVEARGVEDESCGYHPHHTVWDWSAGVGVTTDGREVGWNLVRGINDPPQRLGARDLGRRRGLRARPGQLRGPRRDRPRRRPARVQRRPASGESRRSAPFVEYSYRQPFGSFTGTLPGGLELARGLRRDGAPRRSLVVLWRSSFDSRNQISTQRSARARSATAKAAPRRRRSRSGLRPASVSRATSTGTSASSSGVDASSATRAAVTSTTSSIQPNPGRYSQYVIEAPPPRDRPPRRRPSLADSTRSARIARPGAAHDATRQWRKSTGNNADPPGPSSATGVGASARTAPASERP